MKIDSDWSLSSDKMLIEHKSGFSMKKINTSLNVYEWVPSDPRQKKLACEALRYFYDVEGRTLIKTYIKKYSFDEDDILRLLNDETKSYSVLKCHDIDYENNLLMTVLNEGKPVQLTIGDLQKILTGEAYCYPWISSSLRSAIYKWRKRKVQG